MQLPLQVSFRQMTGSAEIESLIREQAASLDQFAQHIMSCRVVVELVGKHHRHGNLYEVHLDIKLPGGEIAVTREPGQHSEYRDIGVAVRDAFDAARRKIEDYVRRRRGAVKVHEAVPHARVLALYPLSDYGFLRDRDGRDVFFHRQSVADDAFDHLDLGTEVTFVEADEPGDKGPQASTVKMVGRHGHR
jgi:cold shock CspA family protein